MTRFSSRPQNVELVRRSLDAMDRRDLNDFLSLTAEDVTVHPQLADEDHGHAGVRRFWKVTVEGMPDFRMEATEVRDLGPDLTLAVVRVHVHGGAGTTPFDQTYWSPARWRDGKCVWWGVFVSEQAALEAVSLSV